MNDRAVQRLWVFMLSLSGRRNGCFLLRDGGWGSSGEVRGGYNKKRRKGDKWKERLFSISSLCTLRDNLIYSNVCLWINDNLSQSPQSTHSNSISTIQQKPNNQQEQKHQYRRVKWRRGCVCLVYVCGQNIDRQRVFFSAQRIRRRKKAFNFPLEQISIYAHTPLRDAVLPLLLTAFRLARGRNSVCRTHALWRKMDTVCLVGCFIFCLWDW